MDSQEEEWTTKFIGVDDDYKDPLLLEVAEQPMPVEKDAIDTLELADRISIELKMFEIPQGVFAQTVLARSQGTLSDLLRNPRPWKDLKSGRNTYQRMFLWLQQPLHVRLAMLGLYPETAEISVPNLDDLMPGGYRTKSKKLKAVDEIAEIPETMAPPKKRRLVFTEHQKSALQDAFNKSQNPDESVRSALATSLDLSLATVTNYFANKRRRQQTEQPRAELEYAETPEYEQIL